MCISTADNCRSPLTHTMGCSPHFLPPTHSRPPPSPPDTPVQLLSALWHHHKNSRRRCGSLQFAARLEGPATGTHPEWNWTRPCAWTPRASSPPPSKEVGRTWRSSQTQPCFSARSNVASDGCVASLRSHITYVAHTLAVSSPVFTESSSGNPDVQNIVHTCPN